MKEIKKRSPSSTCQGGGASWYLPECINWLNSPPLWYAVAWYCKLQKREICRNEISETFRISPRCAGDILGYIIRNCRKRVDVKHRVKKMNDGTHVLFVSVNDILNDPSPPYGGAKGNGLSPAEQCRIAARRRKEQKEKLSALGRAFLHGKKINTEE